MLLVARPRLPDADALLPYLRRIDAARWYTNGGKLLREFEQRLAAHFAPPGGPAMHVAVVASATVGLTLALQAQGARAGTCPMPSWTFGATACAVIAAGLTPHFVDVNPADWLMDRDQAARLIASRPAGLLLVPPAGVRSDLGPWQEMCAARGVPLVIDIADGFDIVQPLAAPQVVSFHAVKTFGIGEGGCVVSTDAELIARIRRLTNFGIGAERVADEPGINGKLSEYGAAMGLAALDAWPATRARWVDRAGAYRARLAEAGYELLFHRGAACATAMVDLGGPEAVATLARLREAGIEGRRWWGDGCHRQPAFAACPAERLAETERLAARILGLPLHVDLENAEIDRIIGLLPARRGKVAAVA